MKTVTIDRNHSQPFAGSTMTMQEIEAHDQIASVHMDGTVTLKNGERMQAEAFKRKFGLDATASRP